MVFFFLHARAPHTWPRTHVSLPLVCSSHTNAQSFNIFYGLTRSRTHVLYLFFPQHYPFTFPSLSLYPTAQHARCVTSLKYNGAAIADLLTPISLTCDKHSFLTSTDPSSHTLPSSLFRQSSRRPPRGTLYRIPNTTAASTQRTTGWLPSLAYGSRGGHRPRRNTHTHTHPRALLSHSLASTPHTAFFTAALRA